MHYGAGWENRTLVKRSEAFYSTTKLNPQYIKMVPMVGLEPTWFPVRFWVVCVCQFRHTGITLLYNKLTHFATYFKLFFIIPPASLYYVKYIIDFIDNCWQIKIKYLKLLKKQGFFLASLCIINKFLIALFLNIFFIFFLFFISTIFYFII